MMRILLAGTAFCCQEKQFYLTQVVRKNWEEAVVFCQDWGGQIALTDT